MVTCQLRPLLASLKVETAKVATTKHRVEQSRDNCCSREKEEDGGFLKGKQPDEEAQHISKNTQMLEQPMMKMAKGR